MKVKHILLAAVCCTMTLGAKAQNRAVTKTFTRNKVLLEKHTGVRCGWCPSGDAAVNGFMGRHPEYADKMFEMRHNSYSSSDMYTLQFHYDICSMWKVDGHPRYFVDRCHPNGYKYEVPDNYGISWGSFNSETFDPIGRRLSIPTYVSLSMDGSVYNPSTGKLTVTVSGEVTKSLPDLRISVFLTQDHGGYDGTSRAFLTRSVHGDYLPVHDGRYSVQYTYDIPSRIGQLTTDPSTMKVVAFVSSFDDTDFTNSEVHNCDVVSVTSLPNTAPRPRLTCAAPTISLNGQQLHFESNTPGAVYFYNVTSNASADLSTAKDADLSKATFTVTASAGAPGYNDSPEVTKTFTILDLIGDKKDVNGDGTISVTDVPTLIKLMQK